MQGAQTKLDESVHGATAYEPVGHTVEHALHTRSVVSVHGTASNVPAVHAGLHVPQSAPLVGVHAARWYVLNVVHREPLIAGHAEQLRSEVAEHAADWYVPAGHTEQGWQTRSLIGVQ